MNQLIPVISLMASTLVSNSAGFEKPVPSANPVEQSQMLITGRPQLPWPFSILFPTTTTAPPPPNHPGCGQRLCPQENRQSLPGMTAYYSNFESAKSTFNSEVNEIRLSSKILKTLQVEDQVEPK